MSNEKQTEQEQSAQKAAPTTSSTTPVPAAKKPVTKTAKDLDQAEWAAYKKQHNMR